MSRRNTPPKGHGNVAPTRTPSKTITPFRVLIGTAVLAISAAVASKVHQGSFPDRTVESLPALPLSPVATPTSTTSPSIAPQAVHPMFEDITKNRESKKYNYTLLGIPFASDTVSFDTMQTALASAHAKIGGPYWSPQQKLIVEFSAVQTSITDPKTFDVITVPDALRHELCHVLLGPHQDKWPAILAEFFANSASPQKENGNEWHYDTADTNITAIQMRHPDFIRPTQNNYFFDTRKFTLMALSGNMSDEARRAMVSDALKQDTISFDQLDGFMRSHGIDHRIFKKGSSGHQLGAFKSLGSSNVMSPRQFILLVSYDAVGEGADMDENPHPISITLIPKNPSGSPMRSATVFLEGGLHMVDVKKFLTNTLGEEGGKQAKSIEIPEMHQVVTIQ